MEGKFFRWNKNEVRIMLFIMTFMIGLFVFSSPIQKSRSATSPDAIDQYSRNYLELYCGSFANAVPMAVNPTATMAVLSVVGMIERTDEIWPNVHWLEKPRQFLEKIPLIRTAETLPVANPWMAILFTVLTIALYVIRSIKACKAVSQETIDKVERIAGQVANVALVLLQFSQAAMAYAAGSFSDVLKTGATVFGIVLGICAAFMCAVMYFIVSKCIEAIEAIATGVPVAATNFATQAGKFFIHIFATVFQFISVYVAAVLGLIFTGICLFLLIKSRKYMIYYKHIYFNPVWRKIFGSKQLIELVSKKFPRRGRKAFTDITYAFPVFSMRKYPKRIVNREMMWLLPINGEASLVRIRAFRKIMAYPLRSLYENEHVLYMQKTKRFLRILTEEKDLELIFSIEYEGHFETMMSTLGACDFKIVEERRAAEKREQAEAKKAAKAQAREERRTDRRARREAMAAERAEKRQLKALQKAEKKALKTNK